VVGFPPRIGLESPAPFRREALAACRPSSWCGKVRLGLLALGALLPKLVTPAAFRVEYIVRRDEPPPLIRYVLGREAHRVNGDLRMRVLELALAGALALAAPMAAHSAPPGSNVGAAARGPAPGVMQAGETHGANWLPAPGGGGGGWHPPHWGPSRFNGGWGSYRGLGVPTYWVWGPSGGAFDYPFSDWRGPSGGWGNP